MHVESRPCTKVCTMCTPPLAGQTQAERTPPGSQAANNYRRPTNEFALVTSSPQLITMNE
jgi:hypothetical protein